MEKYTGKPISNGIAIGRIVFYSRNRQIDKITVDNIDLEIERYELAKQKAVEQLNALYSKSLEEVGESAARIFEAHIMMVQDEDYAQSVHNIIKEEHTNAEYAVAITRDEFLAVFAEIDDEYFKSRAIDVKDISQRLISLLLDESYESGNKIDDIIIVADDLTPSETVQMDKDRVRAFVTKNGSGVSHTAILARTRNIPALCGVNISKEWDGKMAIVDGKNGILYIEPDNDTLSKYEKEQSENQLQKEKLTNLIGKKNITKSGVEVVLSANIGSVEDVSHVLENDADGIGLFRSEFLYLEKDKYPTEEELFFTYKTVAEKMQGKRVVIRTLDIGADKQTEYLEMEHEDNPAMGYRGIRVCLDRVDMFKTQLRAIYRASVFGNVAIMYPMIISLDEIRQIKSICSEVKTELMNEGIAFNEIETGVMVETPAAVMISDLIAGEVDFLSIGTNDLTQYTLAVDRQNSKLDKLYDEHHLAIMRMIKMVINNAHNENCKVSICGELASDMSLTKEFIDMRVDQLSVSPNLVLPMRNVIVNID